MLDGDTRAAGATPQASAERLQRQLAEAIDGLDVHPAEAVLPGEPTISQLRRSRYQGGDDTIGMLTLTEVDGLLVWEHGTGITSALALPGRRRAGAVPAAPGTIVKQLKFKKLEPNQVGEFLATVDAKCADRGQDGKPVYGLRRWLPEEAPAGTRPLSHGRLVPVERPDPEGSLLLLVHGTFSNSKHILEEVLATNAGRSFLDKAAAKYGGGILVFDHPTLSVSPLLNALDLARLLAGCRGPIDVVSHSRGGLLTRWLLEVFASAPAPPRKAVFVGSPLHGTGLASPGRLRSALTLLTNFSRALEAGGEAAALAVPMLSVVVGIQKVVSSISGVAARTPLFDAAIAMIPGLAAQSRVSNNAELQRLRAARGGGPAPDYYAIGSDFAPQTPAPLWQFWRHFRNLPERLAHAGADVIFGAENDLVVDTASMASFYGLDEEERTDLPDGSIHLFRRSEVHHLRYFREEQTIRSLERWLQV
jgi:hypothetical protein